MTAPKVVQSRDCLICGKRIGEDRYLYCSTRCNQVAASRRYRAKNPELYRERNRRYRAANPEKAREATRRWMATHRRKRAVCPSCGGEMNRAANLCRPCRLRLLAVCQGNSNCGVLRRHAHCPTCNEPMLDRRQTLCPLCLADCRDLGLKPSEYLSRNHDDAKPETIRRREYHRQYRKRRLEETRLNQEVAA